MKSFYQQSNLAQREAELEMLLHSFFLPKDVRLVAEDNGWVIHPIKLATASEWSAAKALLEHKAQSISSDPSGKLVDASDHVGVSIREHPNTGRMFVVAKMWLNADTFDNWKKGN